MIENEYVGYLVKDLEDIGIDYRIVCIDGNYQIVTRDYDPLRINVEVEDGVVVKSYRG